MLLEILGAVVVGLIVLGIVAVVMTVIAVTSAWLQYGEDDD